jgi:hypothetical protein
VRAIGQLRAARDWAEELTNEQLVHNPVSSAAVPPAEVPLGEYSHLPTGWRRSTPTLKPSCGRWSDR